MRKTGSADKSPHVGRDYLRLKLDTTKPEGIELQGESGKISATWHHAVVGRGDAVARRGSSGAAG